jgi:hypothetical protein
MVKNDPVFVAYEEGTLSSIGMAPSITSSPITVAPTKATRFWNLASPNLAHHSLGTVRHHHFLSSRFTKPKRKTDVLRDQQVHRAGINQSFRLVRLDIVPSWIAEPQHG